MSLGHYSGPYAHLGILYSHFDPKETTGKKWGRDQLCHILTGKKNGEDAKAYLFRNSSVLSK